jgi:tripartite-type tricarboxylate transporter receptor subunit TctC
MLAVGAVQRSRAVPDVPTVAGAGFPGYEVYVWWGVVAPAELRKMVRDDVRKWADVAKQAGIRVVN